MVIPLRLLLFTALALALVLPARAREPTLPPGFKTGTVQLADGATIWVRSGGSGPAVVLIHGFGDTGDMRGPLAARLARTHTVIVPDLRGKGRSSKAAGGYDKKSQAADIRAVVEKLGQDRSAVVGHDIGTMVACAYAARYPEGVATIARWMGEGSFKTREHVVEGFENFPSALLMLFKGENLGKLVLKVADA